MKTIAISNRQITSIPLITRPNVINGTSNNDNLVVTSGIDLIYGLAGSDTLQGNAGNGCATLKPTIYVGLSAIMIIKNRKNLCRYSSYISMKYEAKKT